MEDVEISLDDGRQALQQYDNLIQNYLKTGKIDIKPKQFIETYSMIVKLSDESDMSEELYFVYKEQFKAYMETHVLPAITKHVGDSSAIVSEFNSQWKQFGIYTFSMKKMYDYLDRYYLKNGGKAV